MEDSLLNARQYLLEHNVLSLATCVDNFPWVAPVFYCVYSRSLVFLSAPHTRHCRNIVSNSQVAASVQEDYNDWKAIKGIQLQGVATRVSDAELPAVMEAYAKKFPLIGPDAPSEIASAINKVNWFEIAITKLFYIDNAKGLGNRAELEPERLFTD